MLPTTAATGRGLDESIGEMAAEERSGEGELVDRSAELFRLMGEGARRSRDFCPASIDWGITMI